MIKADNNEDNIDSGNIEKEASERNDMREMGGEIGGRRCRKSLSLEKNLN